MTPKESPLNKYYDHVDEVIQKQLAEMEKKVAAIDNTYGLSRIVTILSEANCLIFFASGNEDWLYEEWRYRLFVDRSTGKNIIVQGNEIDIDFKGLMESGKPK